MGKAKQQAKKEARKRAQREAKEAREAERLAIEKAEAQRRAVLIAVPLLTFAAAAGLYFGINRPQLAGMALLIGGVIFLMFGLSAIGGKVEPKDRHRAGAIDFGNK